MLLLFVTAYSALVYYINQPDLTEIIHSLASVRSRCLHRVLRPEAVLNFFYKQGDHFPLFRVFLGFGLLGYFWFWTFLLIFSKQSPPSNHFPILSLFSGFQSDFSIFLTLTTHYPKNIHNFPTKKFNT